MIEFLRQPSAGYQFQAATEGSTAFPQSIPQHMESSDVAPFDVSSQLFQNRSIPAWTGDSHFNKEQHHNSLLDEEHLRPIMKNGLYQTSGSHEGTEHEEVEHQAGHFDGEVSSSQHYQGEVLQPGSPYINDVNIGADFSSQDYQHMDERFQEHFPYNDHQAFDLREQHDEDDTGFYGVQTRGLGDTCTS